MRKGAKTVRVLLLTILLFISTDEFRQKEVFGSDVRGQ